jgi:hypothetical protein
MDADRSGDPLTDSAVDRDLRAMLAVDPSPEFVARVRTRIEQEPAPSAPWGLWPLVFAGGLAAAVTIAVTVARPKEIARPASVATRTSPSATEAARPEPVGRAAPGSGAPPIEPPVRAQESGVASSTRTGPPTAEAGRSVHIANDRRAAPPDADVLVDARESSALRALIRRAREGGVDLAPVLRASTPVVMDMPPVAAIDIPLITIDPIAPGTGEGARQ